MLHSAPMARPGPGAWFGLDPLWWIGTLVASVGLLGTIYFELADSPRRAIAATVLLVVGSVLAGARHIHK